MTPVFEFKTRLWGKNLSFSSLSLIDPSVGFQSDVGDTLICSVDILLRAIDSPFKL